MGVRLYGKFLEFKWGEGDHPDHRYEVLNLAEFYAGMGTASGYIEQMALFANAKKLMAGEDVDVEEDE